MPHLEVLVQLVVVTDKVVALYVFSRYQPPRVTGHGYFSGGELDTETVIGVPENRGDLVPFKNFRYILRRVSERLLSCQFQFNGDKEVCDRFEMANLLHCLTSAGLIFRLLAPVARLAGR